MTTNKFSHFCFVLLTSCSTLLLAIGSFHMDIIKSVYVNGMYSPLLGGGNIEKYITIISIKSLAFIQQALADVTKTVNSCSFGRVLLR